MESKNASGEFKQGLYDYSGKEGILHGNTNAMITKKTLVLLLVSLLKGFFYVLAFPVIAIVTAMSGAWAKRKEKQMLLEREHSRVVAFLSSFVEGLLYVVVFPLIVIGALIKKLALGMLEKQKA